jgi:hypothetical protein
LKNNLHIKIDQLIIYIYTIENIDHTNGRLVRNNEKILKLINTLRLPPVCCVSSYTSNYILEV